jgi:phage repressor protein C with HTH and peptisase S24 domain
MNTWNQRLERALKESGHTPADLARAVGVRPPSVTEWLNGTTKDLKAANAERVCRFLGINQSWLLYGKGPQKGGQQEHPDEAIVAVESREIRLAAHRDGITPQIVEDGHGEPLYYRASWIRKRGLQPERLVAREVAGNSMEPALFDGDLVLIDLAARTPQHGRVFWLSVEGEQCVKRLRKRGAEWWITSDNPAHSNTDLPLESTEQIVGQVVQKSSSTI